jgi:hypothetical protein
MNTNKSIYYFKLIEEIKDNNVYLLVGSGLSISCGYPSWSGLINKLIDKIDNLSTTDKLWIEKQFHNSPDWTAEIIKYKLGIQYSESLRDIFDINDTTASIVHALIALIPFKGYITTNYDTKIEDYLKFFLCKPPKIVTHKEIIKNQANINFNNLSVFKIHGCIKETKHDLVLTTSDYYKVLHDQRYIRLVDYLFAKNIILSIGFSFKDKDFRCFVEERYNLYGANCEPMYVFIHEQETCQIEIDLYREMYNIHIIPILNSEIQNELLDLYCLTQQVDFKKFRNDILYLIINRLKDEGYLINGKESVNDDVVRAKRLLSVFRDPVKLMSFSSICTDNNIPLSPAHYKIISKSLKDEISISKRIEPENKDILAVSQWIEKYFASLNSDKSIKYLHIHDKKKFNGFFETLSFLFSTEIGWGSLIGNDSNSKDRMLKYFSFYRQGGKWGKMLEILNNVESFIDKNNPLFLQIQKQKLWLSFWQRNYNSANQIITKYPEIKNIGHYAQDIALKYMKGDNNSLKEIITTLSLDNHIDFWNVSLLGRALARLAIRTTDTTEKINFLTEADKHINQAIKAAKNEDNLSEISVQMWYLAMIYAEMGKSMEHTNPYLGEVRRLDECILHRIPGIAWLKVADYRLAINADKSALEISKLKEGAEEKLRCLGMQDIETYLDRDYFY